MEFLRSAPRLTRRRFQSRSLRERAVLHPLLCARYECPETPKGRCKHLRGDDQRELPRVPPSQGRRIKTSTYSSPRLVIGWGHYCCCIIFRHQKEVSERIALDNDQCNCLLRYIFFAKELIHNHGIVQFQGGVAKKLMPSFLKSYLKSNFKRGHLLYVSTYCVHSSPVQHSAKL